MKLENVLFSILIITILQYNTHGDDSYIERNINGDKLVNIDDCATYGAIVEPDGQCSCTNNRTLYKPTHLLPTSILFCWQGNEEDCTSVTTRQNPNDIPLISLENRLFHFDGFSCNSEHFLLTGVEYLTESDGFIQVVGPFASYFQAKIAFENQMVLSLLVNSDKFIRIYEGRLIKVSMDLCKQSRCLLMKVDGKLDWINGDNDETSTTILPSKSIQPSSTYILENTTSSASFKSTETSSSSSSPYTPTENSPPSSTQSSTSIKLSTTSTSTSEIVVEQTSRSTTQMETSSTMPVITTLGPAVNDETKLELAVVVGGTALALLSVCFLCFVLFLVYRRRRDKKPANTRTISADSVYAASNQYRGNGSLSNVIIREPSVTGMDNPTYINAPKKRSPTNDYNYTSGSSKFFMAKDIPRPTSENPYMTTPSN